MILKNTLISNGDKNFFSPLFLQFNLFIYTLVTALIELLRLPFNKNITTRKFYFENFIDNLKKIIWNCLPITTLTIGATSVVYAIHSSPHFSKRGLTIYIGGLIALAIIRETVPVMGTLAIITQYCTGMTAEIGSMKITEQIDALKISKVTPVQYLLAPMVLASVIGFPIISMICILFGILVSFVSTKLLIDVSSTIFFNSIISAITTNDLILALVKSIIFGFVVSCVSYTCGILTKGGAKAVGNSTRLSVVINFAVVIILDYLITAIWL